MTGFDRVLVDTHVYVWMISEPERLSEAATEAVVEIDTQVLVSAATMWEIATKLRRLKWPGAATILSTFEDRIELHDLSRLPIGFSHARLAGDLEWGHRDPFDRMLAAQCLVEGLPLVTKDLRLRQFEQVQSIW